MHRKMLMRLNRSVLPVRKPAGSVRQKKALTAITAVMVTTITMVVAENILTTTMTTTLMPTGSTDLTDHTMAEAIGRTIHFGVTHGTVAVSGTVAGVWEWV